jgi:hypothetical protein
VQRALGIAVVLLLAAAVGVAVRRAAPKTDIVHTQPAGPPVTETVIVPAAGQTLVSGTLESFSADDAISDALPTPVTINATERGAKSHATVEGALVNGTRKTIYWDAGTPLPIGPAGGALDLGPAHVDADAKGVTWQLAGAPRTFKPGRYNISSPVAITTGGLATPSDNGVQFTADDHTVLTTTTGVVIHFDGPALQVEGPGTVRMKGRFTVKTASGTRTATSVTMGVGPFRVTLAPGPGGASIDAILHGPVS